MKDIDSGILRAIDSSNIGYAIFDREGYVLHASPSARYLLGFNAEADLSGRKWYELDHDTEEMQAERIRVYDGYVDSRTPYQGILRWVWPDGSRRYYDATATSYSDDKIIIVINDRTAQIESRRKVEHREKLISTILDLLPVGVMLQDRDRRITYINSMLTRRHDGPAAEMIGKTPDEIESFCGDKEIETLFDQVFETGKPVKERQVIIEAGPMKGAHFLVYLYPLVSDEGEVYRVMTVKFDRTDRVKLAEEKSLYQKKLYELQKVEALNRFAGGLAHELSNILHPAGVYARALAAEPDQPDRERLFGRINEAVLQAGDLLRETLAMTRSGGDGPRPVNLNAFLMDLVVYAQDVAPSNIIYHLETEARPLIALADDLELRQVMLNLLVNATDAQGSEGEILIRAGRGGLPPPDMEIVPSSTGPFVWIEVTDQGSGIPDKVRPHIFEPFFTTKKRGKGTGLGLAVVQGMVTGWGGVVSVLSSPGRGSTFRIWIPESRTEV